MKTPSDCDVSKSLYIYHVPYGKWTYPWNIEELPMSTPELRKIWKKYCDDCDRIELKHERLCDKIWDEWKKQPSALPFAVYPPRPDLPFPEILISMTCGAKTRKGTPCKRTDLYHSGRCKFHGGLSTGPITKAGKKRSALNGFKRKVTRTSWEPNKTWLLFSKTNPMKC